MDLHHNLYYSYRGSATSDADRDRQLENNLTKALLNTMCLGGEAVWKPFLRELGIPSPEDAMFLFQRRELPSSPATSKKHRILLGISKRTSSYVPDRAIHRSYESVPDAWIHWIPA